MSFLRCPIKTCSSPKALPGSPYTVDRHTSHVIFLMHFARLIVCILTAWLKTSQGSKVCVVRVSSHLHVIHDVTCLSVRWLFLVCLSPFSLCRLPLLFHTLPALLLGTPSSMSTTPRVKTTALTQNEEYCPMAIYNPLTFTLTTSVAPSVDRGCIKCTEGVAAPLSSLPFHS